jgi:hypothetical protein
MKMAERQLFLGETMLQTHLSFSSSGAGIMEPLEAPVSKDSVTPPLIAL